METTPVDPKPVNARVPARSPERAARLLRQHPRRVSRYQGKRVVRLRRKREDTCRTSNMRGTVQQCTCGTETDGVGRKCHEFGVPVLLAKVTPEPVERLVSRAYRLEMAARAASAQAILAFIATDDSTHDGGKNRHDLPIRDGRET